MERRKLWQNGLFASKKKANRPFLLSWGFLKFSDDLRFLKQTEWGMGSF
jgi:hypothetical protein